MPKGTPKLREAFFRKLIQLTVIKGNLDLSTWIPHSLLAKGEFWVHRAESFFFFFNFLLYIGV